MKINILDKQTTMKLFLLFFLVAAVAAAPNQYKPIYDHPEVPVVGRPEPYPEEALLKPEIAAPPSIATGEIINDGLVQVTVNAPEDAGYFSYLQSWFSMILSYFNGETQVSHQIV